MSTKNDVISSWEFVFIVNTLRLARHVEAIEDKRFCDHARSIVNLAGLDTEGDVETGMAMVMRALKTPASRTSRPAASSFNAQDRAASGGAASVGAE